MLICTPDKDVGQCVDGKHVVQFDRRKRELRDEAGVVKKFGVAPASIPDYLGLVGDSSDGFPGLQGWGPKSAAPSSRSSDTSRRSPTARATWAVTVRGADTLAATLPENRDLAMLFKDIATLRPDEPLLIENVDELRWTGPTTGSRRSRPLWRSDELAERAKHLASGDEGGQRA